VFVRMDSGSWLKVFSHAGKKGKWNWVTRQQFAGEFSNDLAYDLSEGLHVLELAARSEHFSIDRIVLFSAQNDEAG